MKKFISDKSSLIKLKGVVDKLRNSSTEPALHKKAVMAFGRGKLGESDGSGARTVGTSDDGGSARGPTEPVGYGKASV